MKGDRQTRQVHWKDARLSLAHSQGSLSPVYGATLGDPDEAGDQLVHCAIVAGVDHNVNEDELVTLNGAHSQCSPESL